MTTATLPKSFAGLSNDPARKGELAAPKICFGEDNRYAIAPVHSRFDDLAFCVWDALSPDTALDRDPVYGYPPAIIRICTDYHAAIAGLGTPRQG